MVYWGGWPLQVNFLLFHGGCLVEDLGLDSDFGWNFALLWFLPLVFAVHISTAPSPTPDATIHSGIC